MKIPLLLYFSSLRRPKVYKREKAIGLIEKHLESPWATNWPGPLGKFVLKQLSEEELNPIILKSSVHEHRRRERTAVFHFYAGVVALADKKPALFRERMRMCLDIPESKNAHESLLARYELEKSSEI